MAEDVEEYLLLAKERFFEMGISPREFKKLAVSDIKDVLEIKNAWDQKAKREQAINDAVASMQR